MRNAPDLPPRLESQRHREAETSRVANYLFLYFLKAGFLGVSAAWRLGGLSRSQRSAFLNRFTVELVSSVPVPRAGCHRRR